MEQELADLASAQLNLQYRDARSRIESAAISAFKETNSDLLEAHEWLLSAILNQRERLILTRFLNDDPSIDAQLTLLATFIQGVCSCSSLILTGQFVQAAAIIKQELEIIEAIGEYARGSRKDGKTPRLHRYRNSFGRVYGTLNEYAHASVNDRVKETVFEINGGTRAASILPKPNMDLSVTFFGVHLLAVVDAALEQSRLCEVLYGDQFSDAEKAAVCGAIEVLERRQTITLLKNHDDF